MVPVLPEYLLPLKRLDFGQVPSGCNSLIVVMQAADLGPFSHRSELG